MGIFRRKKKKTDQSVSRVITDWTSCEIETTRLIFDVAVVGESHYQEALEKMYDNISPSVYIDVVIVPEPDNPYDPNAIAVMMVNDNNHLETIGYIDKNTAAASKDAMAMLPPTATGFECRGIMKKNPRVENSLIGVWLNLPLASE